MATANPRAFPPRHAADPVARRLEQTVGASRQSEAAASVLYGRRSPSDRGAPREPRHAVTRW